MGLWGDLAHLWFDELQLHHRGLQLTYVDSDLLWRSTLSGTTALTRGLRDDPLHQSEQNKQLKWPTKIPGQPE